MRDGSTIASVRLPKTTRSATSPSRQAAPSERKTVSNRHLSTGLASSLWLLVEALVDQRALDGLLPLLDELRDLGEPLHASVRIGPAWRHRPRAVVQRADARGLRP